MNSDVSLPNRLRRIRWFVTLGLLAVLTTALALDRFVLQREGEAFASLHHILTAVLVVAGTWATLTWASRDAARREAQADRLAALYTIDRAVAQSLDLAEVLHEAVGAAAKALQVEAAGIALLEVDGETLTLRAHRGLSEEFVEAVRRMRVGEGVSGQAAARKSPVVLAVADHPTERLTPLVVREGFQTLASVPLLVGDRVLGALTLGSRRSRAFPPEEMDFLASIGHQVGAALDRARLYTETKQKSERLAALNRISQVIASSLELHTVYEAFGQEVAELVPVDRTSIVFFDEDMQSFEVEAAFTRGQPALMKGARLPVKGSGQEPLVALRQAVLRPDLLEEPPFVEREALIAQGVRCSLAVPLVCKDRLIGAVNFAARQPAAYSEEDVALLTGIVEQVAVAVENSRLYLATAERVAELDTLLEFSGMLRAAGTAEAMLPVIVDQAMRAVKADSALLMLREGDPGRTVVRATAGGAAWLLGREFPEAGGPAEHVLQTDRAEVVADLRADPTLPDDVRARRPPGASGIRLPLRAGEAIVGTMHIAHHAPHTHAPREIRLLTSLADMAATAVQRARLYEQLQQELRACQLAEEALRQSEANYRDLFEAAYDAIFLLDRDGNFIDVNRRVESLTGYSRTELLRMNAVEAIILPEDRPLIRKVLQDAVDGRETVYEVRWQGRDGRILHFEGATTTRFSPQGEFLSTRCTLRDTTDRRQREREFEALATVSAALRAAPTRAEMLPVILDQLRLVLDAAGADFSTLDPVSGETCVELGRGSLARATGARLPAGEGIGGHVIATRRPYVNNAIREDRRFYRAELLGDLSAVACAPLLAQGLPIGALLIGCTSDITPQEVRLLAAIADMAANALHRATLHEQTERQLLHLAALHEIDTAISTSLDLSLTLHVLLDQVTSQLGVDAADVLLLNPHDQSLTYAAGRGFRTRDVEQSRVRLGEGQAGRAALERRILCLPDLWAAPIASLRSGPLRGEGFVSHFVAPLVAKGQIKGVLELFCRRRLDSDPQWLRFLETLATQAAIAIDNLDLFNNLQRSNMELTLAYDATIEGWSHALELRDRETEGHSLRVTEMTLRLARALGVGEADLAHGRRGALLHDIGKMGIPDSILLKPGPLSDDERTIMRQHPIYAHDMLYPIAYLRPALDIPYCHHEKWDGTGYPRGLMGEQIPLAARIFAVVDVWDALRSDRPYRAAWPDEDVRAHICANRGTHFDPRVVDAFLEMET